MAGDPFEIPNYPDMIVLPLVMDLPPMPVPGPRLDSRGRAPMNPPSPGWAGFYNAAVGGLDRHVSAERADLERRWQSAMADRPRDDFGSPAAGPSPPRESRLIMADVPGQPALAVSGISDGELTLWRRGSDAAAPQALATFAVDLDGSLWGAGGKFLGWLFADDRAQFDPDWLRSIGAALQHGTAELLGIPPAQAQEEEPGEEFGRRLGPGGRELRPAEQLASDLSGLQPRPRAGADVRDQTAQVAPTARVAPPQGGEMTLSAEGQEFMYSHETQARVSEHTYWPGTPTSGVTVGPGYDMGSRTRQEVEDDLAAIGVDRTVAQTIAQGAGLRGAAAQAFAEQHARDVSAMLHLTHPISICSLVAQE